MNEPRNEYEREQRQQERAMWREEAKPRPKPARPNAETVPCSAWVGDTAPKTPGSEVAVVGEEGEDCPNCENVGWYPMMNCSSNPWEAEQVQCEWCYTIPNSKFNRRRLAVAAVSPTDQAQGPLTKDYE